MIPLKDQKKQLRQQALARRDALPVTWRIEVSLEMARIADRIEFEPGTVISGFWPMRSEADLRPFMDVLRQKGGRLCLPAILDKTTIVFRELVRGAELVAMGYGTTGPGEDAALLDPAIMLIPLSAFDARGHRIGYGAGYYDRAIERLHGKGLRPRLIGVAFDCQQVKLVPEEPHDVILDEILTESGLRRFENGA